LSREGTEPWLSRQDAAPTMGKNKGSRGLLLLIQDLPDPPGKGSGSEWFLNKIDSLLQDSVDGNGIVRVTLKIVNGVERSEIPVTIWLN